MLIANPIYDSVFKFLLQDLDIAKRFLSIIIGEEIEQIAVHSQEHATPSDKYLLTILRLDFKAIIKTAEGTQKKILIELQKSKNSFDIPRFRHYLGANYTRTEEINGEKVTLPVLPIYFLGFALSIKRAVLKISRQYEDVRTGEILDDKDEFIENLSHDCFVVQVKYLPPEAKTKLEKILSVFNQQWIFDRDQKWLMKYPDKADDEDQKMILKRLSSAAESEEVRDRIEVEDTFDESMDDALRQREKIIAQKDEQLSEKEELLRQQEAENAQLLKMIADLQKQLKE
jgi:hypothetical protein